jgi:ligand-binding sensor domain-containing protein/signal transduction histidine kinase/CheY-like chemotaxis protein
LVNRNSSQGECCLCIFLCLLLILCSIPYAAYSETFFSHNHFRFKYITSIDGLSNNTVYAITQDSEGFIWIGTREGLNKYDGHVVKSYYRTNDSKGIPGNFINDLLVTSSGTLYVGSTLGLAYHCPELNCFHHIMFNGRSLGNVIKLVELSNHIVLVSTTNGLYSIDPEHQATYISELFVIDFCEFRKGVLWAATGEDILLMNPEGEIIKRYNNSQGHVGLDVSNSNIQCMFKGLDGTVWLGTMRDGLWYYDSYKDEFVGITLKAGVNPVEDNFIRAINEDKDGNLWIGTESGLYILNPKNDNLLFFGQSFNYQDQGLNDKAIYAIFRSDDDVMWVGTYFGGVNYASPNVNGFHKIYADGGVKKLSGNALSEIIETRDGKLWIATEDRGINIYDPATGTFEYIHHVAGDPYSLPSNNVHALAEDDKGNIWIGTFIGGLNKYNRTTGQIKKVELLHPIPNLVQHVFSVFIDSRKRTWVGAISGLYLDDNGDEVFHLFNPSLFLDNFIYDIKEDHDGNIWVCTYYNGIYRLDSDLTTVSIYRIVSTPGMSSNRTVFVFPDSGNNIWFGTLDGGLLKYDPVKDAFLSYGEQHGLPNNSVYAITEDHSGKLWLSTNRGLSMFDPTGESFHNYTVHDGLVGNQFNFKSGLAASDGMLYFGAVNGLTYFEPLNLSITLHNPVIHLTDFRLFNRSLAIGEEKILSKNINYQQAITLKHRHKVFTIEFVALNYFSPKSNEYAYFLEGLETDWNYVGTQNQATYTNLSPGSYTFHLKATAGDGLWTESERTLAIRVKPPFWLSFWGILLYVVFGASILAMYIRFLNMRQREKINMELAIMEKQQNEALSQHRLNFFTYISHEFKTPLTLIITVLEQFLSYEDMLPQFRNYGMVIRKNAFRLLFLINQLMEFRRIETDHESVQLNKGEIIGFIKSTFDSFGLLMNKKGIEGVFTSNIENFVVYFDADKLEKIITNLIINSCNSFDKAGKLSMDVQIFKRNKNENLSSFDDHRSDLVMTIRDEGKGLSEEKIEKIFEPFFSEGPKEVHSSGIGLSLVKSLVTLLNGHIQVKSTLGKGSSFSVYIPLIHNPSSEYVKDDVFIDTNSGISPEENLAHIQPEEMFELSSYEDGSTKKYELLIAEDNRELTSFLAHHFSDVFKVITAFDGAEALHQAREHHPDLIISDIMMPEMDGLCLCNAIKDSIETCHIPVILLTAKAGPDSRIEGLHKGADSYVEKPFNLTELDLQVRNILRAKENLRKYFLQFNTFNDTINQLCNKDQRLIKGLSEEVLAHLDDIDLDVEFFCKKVGMSRTLLHMKLKKITGLSTTEFINTIRLNEAMKMLKEGSCTVSEVAYSVGFNDPAYFSRSFKKKFKKSPSSFIPEYPDPN